MFVAHNDLVAARCCQSQFDCVDRILGPHVYPVLQSSVGCHAVVDLKRTDIRESFKAPPTASGSVQRVAAFRSWWKGIHRQIRRIETARAAIGLPVRCGAELDDLRAMGGRRCIYDRVGLSACRGDIQRAFQTDPPNFVSTSTPRDTATDQDVSSASGIGKICGQDADLRSDCGACRNREKEIRSTCGEDR